MQELKGVVVLEGADCSGKSTLAKYFKEQHGAVVIHMTHRFKSNMFAYNTAVLKKAWALSQNSLVVLDRSFLSEMVYAEVFRDGGKWPLIDRYVESVLQRLGYVGIMCQPYPGFPEKQLDLYKKHVDRNHPYKLEAYKQIQEQYAYLMRTQTYLRQWLTYSFIDQRPEDLAAQVLVKFREFRRTKPDYFDGLTGNPSKARLLIVGEQVNEGSAYKRLNWPFHNYAHSSLWLHSRLSEAQIPADRVCFINSWNKDEPQHAQIFSLLSSWPQLKALPLGKTAASVVKSAVRNSPLCKTVPEDLWLPHPQYSKRFGGEAQQRLYSSVLSRAYTSTFN